MSRNAGERHHRAKLTDGEVELIRSEYEAGGWSYQQLADKFEVSKELVAKIVRYEVRNVACT